MAQVKAKGFDIDSLRIASPCHIGWDAMHGDERVRHCDSCQLNVFNVAAMTSNEVEQLVLEREGRLCIRMYRRADGTVITKDCPVGLRAYQKRVAKVAGAALTAIFGLFSVSFAQKGDKSVVDPSKIKVERTVNNRRESDLKGVIRDPKGAVVPGATITLTSAHTRIETTSSVDGTYSFVSVADGVYDISLNVLGFKEFEIKGLLIEKSETLRLDIELEIRTMVTTMGVAGTTEDPIIGTTEPVITSNITPRRIQDLPIKH